MESMVSRRNFARGLALAPLGLAASSMLGQVIASGSPDAPGNGAGQQATPSKRIPKTAAEYNRHPPIYETDPFAETLSFARKDLPVRIRPFALHEVQLERGPLQQARDWNWAYMLRLRTDRLLHNFRLNAGLPSNADPLGG